MSAMDMSACARRGGTRVKRPGAAHTHDHAVCHVAKLWEVQVAEYDEAGAGEAERRREDGDRLQRPGLRESEARYRARRRHGGALARWDPMDHQFMEQDILAPPSPSSEASTVGKRNSASPNTRESTPRCFRS